MPENGKSKRHRSPEHPAFGLKEAIEKARVLYLAEHFNYANVATALEHWGYKPKSGSGLRLLAALGHFGLLEEEGTGDARKVKLSDRGKVVVLKDPGDPEWDHAVHKAALAPSIYLKLWEAWSGNGRLPHEKTMAYDLALKWGFNPNAIDSFISDFKGSLEFANLLENDTLSKDGEAGEEPEETDDGDPFAPAETDHTKDRSMPSTSATAKKDWDLTIPLIEGGQAILRVPIPVTEESFDLLKGVIASNLDAMKRAIVRDPESPELEDEG